MRTYLSVGVCTVPVPFETMLHTKIRKKNKPGYQKRKTDSFKENNTMSTGSSFNPQHEISDRVRSKFFIDDEWKSPSGSAKLDLISPNTEELLLRVPEAYPELQGQPRKEDAPS